MIRLLDIIEDTMVDGTGLRTSIYCAGCRHHCKACHNPESWDMMGGREVSIDEIMQTIMADPFTEGVTFTGGDPMFQAEAFTKLARAIRRSTNKNIWCYTGFSYEAILRLPEQRSLLELCDVLVDGPFVEALKDPDLLFRGSSNQRIIDVAESLRTDSVVLWHNPLFNE